MKWQVNFIKFCTQFGDFGMQVEGINPLTHQSESNWTPENGLLGVTTHQEVSQPLSRLISDTAKLKVKPDEIQPYIKMIYTFS